jgi:hypothetical protein
MNFIRVLFLQVKKRLNILLTMKLSSPLVRKVSGAGEPGI